MGRHTRRRKPGECGLSPTFYIRRKLSSAEWRKLGRDLREVEGKLNQLVGAEKEVR